MVQEDSILLSDDRHHRITIAHLKPMAQLGDLKKLNSESDMF